MCGAWIADKSKTYLARINIDLRMLANLADNLMGLGVGMVVCDRLNLIGHEK